MIDRGASDGDREHVDVDPGHLYQLMFAGIDPQIASAILAHFEPTSLGDLPRDIAEYERAECVGPESAARAIEATGRSPIDSTRRPIDLTG